MLVVSLVTEPKGAAKAGASMRFDQIRYQATTGIDPTEPDLEAALETVGSIAMTFRSPTCC